jgi:REP element-mobilizing transposase RayT
MWGRQTSIEFRTHGGRRKGAGRKRSLPGLPRAPHARRDKHQGSRPVHATFRVRRHCLPSLRCLRRTIETELRNANRHGFRVVHYSIQLEHLHLIVEADDADSLRRGMQGLAIRLAKGLNRHLGRRGKVFADRWHGRELRTPREVRNALVYVLFNRNRHNPTLVGPDPCSSAIWFSGWAPGAAARIARAIGPPAPLRPTVDAETWLAATGFQKFGLLGFDERPRDAQ